MTLPHVDAAAAERELCEQWAVLRRANAVAAIDISYLTTLRMWRVLARNGQLLRSAAQGVVGAALRAAWAPGTRWSARAWRDSARLAWRWLRDPRRAILGDVAVVAVDQVLRQLRTASMRLDPRGPATTPAPPCRCPDHQADRSRLPYPVACPRCGGLL